VLPVHLYGQAADVIRLRAMAAEHDLVLIEDAAQAHGATLDGQRLGSFGQAGCFSFYPGKNLGAFGEGGAVVTNDVDIAQRIRRLRDHAQDGRHNHVEMGFNARMEGLQGAVLSAKLRHLDRWNEQRRRHATHYRELLNDIGEIVLPREVSPDSHVWHLFVIQLPDESRDALRDELTRRGVATGVHYPVPVPHQPAYRSLGYRTGDFPIAETVMKKCLSLPMFAELSEEQIRYVADQLRASLSQWSTATRTS
jgi:dTDP-4-amino-4,6-dideoxygalactose transaminase